MKFFTVFAFVVLSVLLVSSPLRSATSAQDGRKPPDVSVLGIGGKVGDCEVQPPRPYHEESQH